MITSLRFALRRARRTASASIALLAALGGLAVFVADLQAGSLPDGRYLYAAAPGIRNYLEFGGHGVLVFDIDDGFRFVKRIPARGLGTDGKPMNVKGVAACARTGRLYVSTLQTLQCFDLIEERLLWERPYEGGCDRMGIDPRGRFLYLPSLEKDHWHVVDGQSGDVLARIDVKSGAHNTVVSLDGREAYLAGLRSPMLRVADTRSHRVVREVGPFGNVIRPFTVNRARTRAYVNVNDLLGFEVGDLKTGRVLHRVEVPGFQKGPVKRHGCPSHGAGLTPDETELWVADAANQRMHVFDLRGMNRDSAVAPRYLTSIALRDQPGWVTFTLDGKVALPSTGEIVDVESKRIVGALADEQGREVHSEKMVEIHWRNGRPTKNGDQFGLGRRR